MARQGLLACEALERGQAETPLGNYFREISEAPAAAPFSLIVLGLTQQARSAALAWIAGQDHRVFTIHVPKEVGLVEVQLQGQGFVLEKADGARQEFSQVEPFLDAVKNADLVRSGDAEAWMGPLCLRVAAPPGVQGLRLLMPENLSALLSSPAMLRRLVAGANLLVVAGPASYEATDADRGALSELASMLEVVRPLVLADTPELSRRGWWSDRSLLGARHLLPPLPLDPARSAALPPLLTDARDPLRQSLFLSGVSKRLQSAVEMMSGRVQEELHQLTARQTAAGRRLKTIDESARKDDPRAGIDKVRDEIMDELSKLFDGIRELSRKALLPGSRALEQIKKTLEGLAASNLRQEPGFSTIKLTVDAKFLDRISDVLRQTFRDLLRADMVFLRDGLALLREQLSRRLSEIRGAPASVDLPGPDEREILDAVTQMVSVEIKYQGEMPKRGFWRRLSEGRRVVFVILMFASLFGGLVGFNRRAPWVTLALLVIFIGGFIWTFHSWTREDAERLEKELDRVREALEAESRRLLADADREKMTRLQAHMERLRREIYRAVDEASREGARARAENVDREREELRTSTRLLDQRVREYQSHAQRISQIRQACAELDAAVRDVLSGLVRA